MLSETDFLKIKELISESKEMDTESKSELLERLNKSNISGYGLNFVRSVEEVEKETYPFNKNKFIFVGENTEKEIFKGEEYTNNFLFEGDNLESLKVLRETHKNGIDVIYIDPPYNTGNKDFVYNDSFVSNDDGFRHSKWLSFMDKRLRLARELMTDDGVIFISIDEHEQAQLKLLGSQIFGEDNYITTFIWEKTQHTGRQKLNTYSNVEYIITFAKKLHTSQGSIKNMLVEKTQTLFEDAPLYNGSNNERDLLFKKGTVYFRRGGTHIKTTNNTYKLLGSVETEESDGKVEGYPYVNKNDFVLRFASRWSQNELDRQVEDKETVFLVKTDSFAIRALYNTNKKDPLTVAPWQLIKTTGEGVTETAYGTKVGTTSSGTSEITNILGDKGAFSYPKPTSLIKYLVSLVNNKNATVLDFFAGSGTIGHAVLELNSEDGGNRNFILCTNNENNICEEVTYQRLSKVINGYTTPTGKVVDGIPANLNYVKVEHIDTNEIYDFSELDVIPYIELKEGVRYNCVNSFEYCESKNKYVFLVSTDSDMLSVEEFLESSDEKEVVIYCNNISVRNKYVNTPYYLLFKSINEKDILSISKS